MSLPSVPVSSLEHRYPFRPDLELWPRQVKAMLDERQPLLLLDCRTPREQAVASIAGATLIPLQELAARVQELEDQKDSPIVVHCHKGVRSLQATLLLRQVGFANVRSMAGGIDLWSVDVDPSVPRY